MTDILARALAFAVVIQAGFVTASVLVTCGIYVATQHRLRFHVVSMMVSYLMLTSVICYNVAFGYVSMPPLTAGIALAGFAIGDIALAQLLTTIMWRMRTE